ncbi:MAG: alpha-mannosidase [Pseudomonadota bacterium]
MLRRVLLSLAAAALLLPGQASAAARTSIFYYPWYGTPKVDGRFMHWQQNGAAPPSQIASAFYPARGPYSSADRLVLAAQMDEIHRAGVDQIAVSWWGWGSIEDQRLALLLPAARAVGLDVAAHLEPYARRTAASTARDVAHLHELGIADFYVYGPQDDVPESWKAANAALPEGVRMFAQTPMVGWAAAGGFDGVYTYDVLVFTGDRFVRLCDQARKLKLLCAPSVGPGYDARRAVGDMRVRPRRNGRTYDGMWGSALRARADMVTITSYNEWHEGSQIEPARARRGYRGYDGAWGVRGPDAERAYLDRTAYWTARFSLSRASSRVAAGTAR